MPEQGKRYRLITRSDMDGLVCGVLLKELDIIDDILFAHPKDMQDGLIQVGPNDITTNLPYVEGVFLAFDHHASELSRVTKPTPHYIIDPNAPSAAHVVFAYFGGIERFPNISDEMMYAVDKADSARFTMDDISNPQGWELLSFIMDARTGLGRFKNFNISNYQLMLQLIDLCRFHYGIDELLALPDVKERVDLYREHHQKHKEMLHRCARIHNNVIVLDLTGEDTIYAGNRFLVYAMFPGCNISIHRIWGKNRQNTVFAIGKSTINRSSQINIGKLCLEYNGGGHIAAGTCQVANEYADIVLQELVMRAAQDI
ncbi:MAG: exopolyphosphatase [Micavibrio aeruginosavorus]|uniref:Exopolyphosphatase n=1 Tax=Micavibrio aeruginosavorus TaxID=349221 RepID=A0A2W5HND2_9BACT|nr:MAG: exopolyphosphatase [Micavibrio aeruginosavorus]